MEPTQIALFTLLSPLASAVVIALFFRRNGSIAATISVASAAVVAAGGLMLAYGGHRFDASLEWFRFYDFGLSLGFKFDDLAALMISIVGVVGFCVHLFSLGYMADDDAKARFFGGLSIFMFSMIGIVLADNLFMMFVFWELVGFSSYLLINHYCLKQSAAEASRKAFIVNRVGDFGFLIGILMCYGVYGTVNLNDLAMATTGGAVVATAIPLLLFCGAMGKSAQVPLHVWLPDAMEGPTPVSALIHAATMVAAGIYMLCRIEMLMVADALTVIMWVGTFTAIYAALCAIVQSDIKKVLAYSTLSQLGYMVAAFGLGAGQTNPEAMFSVGAAAAMFHLTTHAFFKALLFLGSGSVIHGCHHEQDMFKMGGLLKKMPLTAITMLIGVLAIGGLPFVTAGFFSKDAILHLAQVTYPAVFGILVFTAVLTTFYMVRMWKLTFLGAPRSDSATNAHEGGFVTMQLPLIVLAVLSIFGGYTHGTFGFIYQHSFEGVWSQIPHPESMIGVVIMSLAILGIGGGLAWVLYPSSEKDGLESKVPGAFAVLTLLKESFDKGYTYYVAKVQDRFAMLLNFLDQIVIGGLIVRGFAGFVGLFGLGARALHVGSLHAYVYWFLLGTVILWGFAGGLF